MADELLSKITFSFNARWNDKGSGASLSGGFWHPRSEGDYRPLGSVGVDSYQNINGNSFAQLIRGSWGAPSNAAAASPVASPIGYSEIWRDSKSGADKNGSFWRPVPPNGYVSLGDVAQAGYSPPSVNDVWCVRADLVKPSTFGAQSIWDDKKSGATSDVSIWEIQPDTGGRKEDLLGPIRASGNYDPPNSNFAFLPVL